MRVRTWNVWGSWKRLFLPMRGYELNQNITDLQVLPVISPHEGLWEGRSRSLCRHKRGYFSPWGVMRDQARAEIRSKLGYFSPWGVMRGRWWRVFCVSRQLFLPMRGYETTTDKKSPPQYFKLFLPMRGYETDVTMTGYPLYSVISPHEGLWGLRFQPS